MEDFIDIKKCDLYVWIEWPESQDFLEHEDSEEWVVKDKDGASCLVPIHFYEEVTGKITNVI